MTRWKYNACNLNDKETMMLNDLLC